MRLARSPLGWLVSITLATAPATSLAQHTDQDAVGWGESEDAIPAAASAASPEDAVGWGETSTSSSGSAADDIGWGDDGAGTASASDDAGRGDGAQGDAAASAPEPQVDKLRFLG